MDASPGIVAATALTLVAFGLALTIRVQIRPLRSGRSFLDLVALAPEWRFYAQASTMAAIDLARDPHLVIRDRDAIDRVEGWRPVLWPPERRLSHAVWNPAGRVEEPLLSIAEDLSRSAARGGAGGVQQSLGYLALLRRALAAHPDLPPPSPGAVARQFAIVHAVGRGRRDLSIDFVSAWHPLSA